LARTQPSAKAAKTCRTSAERCRGQSCRTLLLHEGDKAISVDLADACAKAEMPLERSDVTAVGANGVSRQISCSD
jgi:hypothetical protein